MALRMGHKGLQALAVKRMHTACLGLRLGQWGCHFWNLHQILHLHGVPHFSLGCHSCCAMTLHSVGVVILHPKEQISLICSCTPNKCPIQIHLDRQIRMICLSKSDKLPPHWAHRTAAQAELPLWVQNHPPTVHIEQQIRLIC